MIYDWHEHVVVCYIDFADTVHSIQTIKTLISNESLQQLVRYCIVWMCVGSCLCVWLMFFLSK